MVAHFRIGWECLRTREGGDIVGEEGREHERELKDGRGGKFSQSTGEAGSMRCLTATTV